MKKFFQVIVGILAVLGVLFLVLLFWPEDEEESADTEDLQSPVVAQQAEGPVTEEAPAQAEDEPAAEEAPAQAAEETSVTEAPAAAAPAQEPAPQTQEPAVQEPEAAQNGKQTTEVVIPASEITDTVLKFRTTTLDQKPVSQELFSDYDLTIVHVWGTFCMPCIREMGDYAKLYDELPDNVNLVGLLDDVYDGIDSNVATANEILDDNNAKFMNLRTSDDLYDVLDRTQYVPSTFFVDREGHIVGEILDGVRYAGTKKRLDGYLK